MEAIPHGMRIHNSICVRNAPERVHPNQLSLANGLTCRQRKR